MSEQLFSPPLPERPNFFRAYSGINKTQFLKCALIKDGNVYFDKTRAVRQSDEIYYTNNLATAFIYACSRADELKDSPLVMSGLLDNSFRRQLKLESDLLFPVDTVWAEAEGKYWRFVWNDLAVKNPEKVLKEGLTRFDPLEFLKTYVSS